MISQKTVEELYKLQPSALISLYELDVSDIVEDLTGDEAKFRFYDGQNFNFERLVFNGEEYYAIPMEAEGFSFDSQKPPRPKIRIANIKGFISELIMVGGNLEGAKIYRRRVFLRSIDNNNFPNGANPFGIPDPMDRLQDEEYTVDRKTTENSTFIEFELSNPIDLENVKIPSNQVLANVCRHQYRGRGCNYRGFVMTNKDNKTIGFNSTYEKLWAPEYEYQKGTFVYTDPIEKRYYLRTGESGKESTSPEGGNLNYKEIIATEWVNSQVYNSGDVAFAMNKFQAPQYYFCKVTHMGSLPASGLSNTNLWSMDICTKSLRACSFRFADNYPFGGYPGTATLPFD
jgi:lambda family phage minor tail protein L